MKAFLRAFDLWKVIEIGRDPPVQRHANPTLAQIKQHSKDIAKRYKILFCFQFAVSDSIFTRIMTFNSPKKVWDKFRKEFQGSEQTRQIQILNLLREFEVLKMKDDESVKEYIDKVMKIVNQLRLLGEDLNKEEKTSEKLTHMLYFQLC